MKIEAELDRIFSESYRTGRNRIILSVSLHTGSYNKASIKSQTYFLATGSYIIDPLKKRDGTTQNSVFKWNGTGQDLVILSSPVLSNETGSIPGHALA